MHNVYHAHFYNSLKRIFISNNLKPPPMQITYFDGQDMKVKEFKPLESEIIGSPGPLFDYGEKLDYKHLVDVYSEILEAAESSNFNYMVAVNYYYLLLETGKVPDAYYEDILDNIKITRPTNPDIFYAQGINYYHNADSRGELDFYNGLDGEYLQVYVQDKEYSRAIECFEQAIFRDPNNAELYYLLAGCLAAIGKIEEAFNLLTEADALHSSFDLGATKYLNKGLRTALRFIITNLILEDKYDDAYEIGKRLSNLQPLDQHSCVVLDMIFRKYGKYVDAIKMWSFARKLYPSEILPLHFIGINLTKIHKFYFASRYFFREIKNIDDYIRQKGFGENNRLIAQILFDFTLGMYYWKEGQKEEARKHFNSSVELIKANNLENYRPITVLPKLMEVDAEIGLISSSDNCEEFSERLYKATESMNDILKESGYYSEEIFAEKDGELGVKLESIKEAIDYLSSTSIYLERLLRTKSDFLISLLIISAKGDILLETVNLIKRLIPYYDEKATNINNGLDFLKKVEDKINIQIDSLNEMGYSHEADAFNALLKYSRRLGIRTIEEVSVEEWPEIMDSLRIPLKNIGESITADSLGDLNRSIIGQINININIVQGSQGLPEETVQTIERREDKAEEKVPVDIIGGEQTKPEDHKRVNERGEKKDVGDEGARPQYRLILKISKADLDVHVDGGKEAVEELQYARLVYLAAVRIKQGDRWVNKNKELLYPKYNMDAGALKRELGSHSNIIKAIKKKPGLIKLNEDMRKDQIFIEISDLFEAEYWNFLVDEVDRFNEWKNEPSEKESIDGKKEEEPEDCKLFQEGVDRKRVPHKLILTAIRSTTIIRNALALLGMKKESREMNDKLIPYLRKVQRILNYYKMGSLDSWLKGANQKAPL